MQENWEGGVTGEKQTVGAWQTEQCCLRWYACEKGLADVGNWGGEWRINGGLGGEVVERVSKMGPALQAFWWVALILLPEFLRLQFNLHLALQHHTVPTYKNKEQTYSVFLPWMSVFRDS